MTEQAKEGYFQRKTAGSFRKAQLLEILGWYNEMALNGHGEETVGELTAGIEDGKKRLRYQLGIAVLIALKQRGEDVDNVHEVLVWQNSADQTDRTVEVKSNKTNGNGLARFVR